MAEQEVTIHTEYIKLEQLLKLSGAAESGGQAKERIAAGEVTVNGERCLMRGKKLRPGDTAVMEGILYRVTAAQA